MICASCNGSEAWKSGRNWVCLNGAKLKEIWDLTR